MDIELRLLRSFVAIYELGSLSRAAEKLRCTQAAMSMRLKLVETELGEALFRRLPQGLEPTTRAAEFYARALGVLAAYDEMISATRSGKPRQRLRLGVPDDYALGILPRALSRLGPDSGQEIEIVCDLSASLAARLQQKQLDLALLTLAARPAAALFEAELALCWVRRPGFAPQPGAPLPLAAYPEGCVFRRAMTAALDGARRSWFIQAQSRTHAGVVAAVRSGLAVTSMARGTAPAGLEEAAAGESLPPLPDVPVYLLGDPRARLAQLLQDELAGLAGPGNWRRSA
ncbi:LysR family transcriptional regulator [Aestuariivirga sp.]|uniref:LysR family transcriptional regulator n=1 Tax=Aestuariivirga sp. TaxID=2650926 RepID=UPI00391D262B